MPRLRLAAPRTSIVAGGRIIAVIDVGSNSVRLLVARELSSSAFEVIDEERFDARLGEGLADGFLTEAAIQRGIEAVRLVAEVAASYGPAVTVATGTEALRRATNAGVFLEAARRNAGLPITILSGADEAFASYLGVVNSTSIGDGCIVDIGGGSLELIEVKARRLASSQSSPFGALFAAERYLHGDPPTRKEVRALRKAVRQQVQLAGPYPSLYGAGGCVRNLARIVRLQRHYPLRRLHGLAIDRREIRRLAEALSVRSADDRRRFPGVSANRADILHAAAIVVDEVMETLGAGSLIVSGQGLREGLVWQEIRGQSPVLPDVRAASIGGLARANGVDDLAAEPVVHASAQLFEATSRAHGLGPEELGLLVAAARLAGIGMHIDFYNRDRHAEYLVHSGDLHGFSHREIVLLGALVRCADSGTPDLSLYRDLVEAEDLRKVTVLAALLGAARAVRRRVPSPVLEFQVVQKGQALRMTLRGPGPFDAEVTAIERQQKRFLAALKLSLEVSAA